uniref:Uncharacterized protein n=1 Tax=Anguilla anguilla TaxID=7936 RepID=A0A0E9V999_ANGAN
MRHRRRCFVFFFTQQPQGFAAAPAPGTL